MLKSNQHPIVTSSESLVEGEDFYWEGDAMVFTARYHLRRGYCCDSGCRNCPYGEGTVSALDPIKKRTD